ncbi:hypothetical protein [Yoonia sp.]|uniref:hypothetical protein n=1 Tax=Yoonia sp. TaxID=2212373 RepID=UPI0019EE5F79|nr:hypothetical protein [Yoonia sp.]MBE0414501.1 hypothetical protein [Yoonia sp.]
MRLLCFLICLGACAQFPALDATISDAARNAPYPRLTPLPALPPEGAAPDHAVMQARIAALQDRADLLRETDIAALQ